MAELLQAVATMFSLINPVMCAAIFSTATVGASRSERVAAATKAVAVIGLVLVIAAFAGARILAVFGISMDAFSMTGGGILAFIGFSMLVGNASSSTADDDANGPKANRSLSPLIIFAASPGSITGVITISATHSGTTFPATALVAIALVLTLVWGLLVITSKAGSQPHKKGVGKQMMTRYMGLIVIAMGVQFMLSGITGFVGTFQTG